MQLDHDQLPLDTGREELEIDARREHAVVAWEAHSGGRRDLVGGGEERVDSAQQLLPERAARRIAEPFRGEEGGDRECLRVPKREIRDARKAGLETVDDVEAALAQRERDVRPNPDGHAQARPPRDLHRRADRDHVRGLAAVQRPSDRRAGPPRDSKARAR